MSHAPRIDVGNDIALTAPVAGVGRFEFGHTGDCSRRNADYLPFVKTVAGALAKAAPGNQGGNVHLVHWTIDIGIDGNTVTQFYCYILLTENARLRYICPRVKRRAKPESCPVQVFFIPPVRRFPGVPYAFHGRRSPCFSEGKLHLRLADDYFFPYH